MRGLADRMADPRLGALVRALAERAIEVRVFDSALALASRLFVAVIPVTLLVTALLPSGQTFADRLVSGLSLEGAGRAAAERLFATPDAVWAGMTAATCLVVTYSLMSCGGVLQRTYRAAWRLDADAGEGWRTEARSRLLWAAGLVAYVAATLALAGGGDGALPDALRALGRVALALAFFAWTPYVLLGRRIAPRRLLLTAILGALALAVLTAVGPIYVPRLASASAESYGLVGFAFTFLTWLYVHAVLIVGTAVAGAVLGERRRPGALHSSRNPPATRPAPSTQTMGPSCR